MTFDELKSKWIWRPIRNCPGRFILLDFDVNTAPDEIAGADITWSEFRVESARDIVIVGRMCDGGMISYRRKDGTYLHTLNTVAGFERKLTELGIRI